MYDDGEVSLQQPPTDPGDQMLEDSEEMLQDADALVSNRYADILLGVSHVFSVPEYMALVLSLQRMVTCCATGHPHVNVNQMVFGTSTV